MTKTALLLLALYGLGDDDFRVRQASERYLAASGYVVVPLNRLAPRCLTGAQARATLRRLEGRYYGALFSGSDDLPALSVLHPDAVPCYGNTRFLGWRRVYYVYPPEARVVPRYRVVRSKDPCDVPILERDWPLAAYFRRTSNLPGFHDALRGRRPNLLPLQRAMTALFLEDARAWGVPGPALSALLRLMRWREGHLLAKHPRP
jgi:hypothetical protein